MVVVSHDRESAEKYGDRIIELKSGKIISDSGEKNQQPCSQNAIAPAILADETPIAAKKRGVMPFKTLFRMGAAMLVARPVRLVLCCLICLLAFTILGVADTINAYDRSVALVNSLDAINADYVSLNVKVEGKKCAYEGLTLRQYEFLKSNVKSDRLYKVYGSLGVGVGPIKELDVDVGWGGSVGYNTYAGGVAGKLVESADRDMHTLKPLFTWVSVAMVVLSALMILYYASGVVQEKRREIGILRALGAGERDIAAIFAINNGIFVVTIIVLSCLLAAVGAVLANSCIIAAYSIAATVIPFGIRQILVLAGVAIIAMVVGIAVPVIRLMRSKPVDIIAGRQ